MLAKKYESPKSAVKFTNNIPKAKYFLEIFSIFNRNNPKTCHFAPLNPKKIPPPNNNNHPAPAFAKPSLQIQLKPLSL